MEKEIIFMVTRRGEEERQELDEDGQKNLERC